VGKKQTKDLQLVTESQEVMVPETVDDMRKTLDAILPDGEGGKLTLQHGPFAITLPLGGTIASIAKAFGLKGRNVAGKGDIKVGLDVS
jgi:hypothetical protein